MLPEVHKYKLNCIIPAKTAAKFGMNTNISATHIAYAPHANELSMQHIATSKFTFEGSFVYKIILTESKVNTYWDILNVVDINPFAHGVVRSEPIANAKMRPIINFAKCE